MRWEVSTSFDRSESFGLLLGIILKSSEVAYEQLYVSSEASS